MTEVSLVQPVAPVSSNIHRLRNATKFGQAPLPGKSLDPDELYRALEGFKLDDQSKGHQGFTGKDKPSPLPAPGYRHVPQFAASDFMSTATAELPENVTIHPLSLSAMEATILTPERRASVAPDRRASILPDRRASIMPDRRGSVISDRRGSVMPDRQISSMTDRRSSTVLGLSALPGRRLSTAQSVEERNHETHTTQPVAERNNFQLTRAQAAAQAAQVEKVRNINHFQQRDFGKLWVPKKQSEHKANRRSMGPGPVDSWKPLDFGIESQSPRRHTIYQSNDQHGWTQKDEDAGQRRGSLMDKILLGAHRTNKKISRGDNIGKAEDVKVAENQQPSQRKSSIFSTSFFHR